MKKGYQCNECGWSGTRLVRGDGGYLSCPRCGETLGDGFLHKVRFLTPAERETEEKEVAKQKLAREATEKIKKKEREEQWAANSEALAVITLFIDSHQLTSSPYGNTVPVKHGDEGGELLAGRVGKDLIRAIWFPKEECLWVWRPEQDDYRDVWLWRPYIPVDPRQIAEKRQEQLVSPGVHLLGLITGQLERAKFAEGSWVVAYKLAVFDILDDPSTHEGILDTIRAALLRDTLTPAERATPSNVRLASYYSRIKQTWDGSEERRKAETLGLEAEAKVAWEKRKAEAELLETGAKRRGELMNDLQRSLARHAKVTITRLTSAKVEDLLRQEDLAAAQVIHRVTKLAELLEALGSGDKIAEEMVTADKKFQAHRETWLAKAQEILDTTGICETCGVRAKPATLKRHAKKHAAEAAQKAEEERLARERHAIHEAEQARYAKERELRLVAEKKKREEELHKKGEELKEREIQQGLDIEKAIKKLRNSPKHPASEKQIGFTESLFTEIFGYEMSEEAKTKLDGASKKSVSGIITQVMALGIKQTIDSGRGDQPAPSEKQLRYARSLVARVNSYEWDSTKLGKAGVPFPGNGILQRLSKRDISAVIDSLKYSVGKSNGY